MQNSQIHICTCVPPSLRTHRHTPTTAQAGAHAQTHTMVVCKTHRDRALGSSHRGWSNVTLTQTPKPQPNHKVRPKGSPISRRPGSRREPGHDSDYMGRGGEAAGPGAGACTSPAEGAAAVRADGARGRGFLPGCGPRVGPGGLWQRGWHDPSPLPVLWPVR